MNWFKRAGGAFSGALFKKPDYARPDGQPHGFHIAILSYDRPKYLEQVLASLRPQLTKNDRVTLFQDGYAEKQNSKPFHSKRNIRTCVKLFRKHIPWGEVLESKDNLGIALNYERAEKHVFENLEAAACLFLEDDLVLSPSFLQVTEQLLSFAHADNRIGYVSACGNLWASLEEQSQRANELMPMHENWGAAMTRKSWLAERPYREAYLNLVRTQQYELRDHEEIIAMYAAQGWECRFTSQDSSRWIACLERGVVRVSTFACHAKYIGAHGVHFTPELFDKGRFAKTVMSKNAPLNLMAPDSAFISKCIEEEDRRFTGKGEPFYPSHGT